MDRQTRNVSQQSLSSHALMQSMKQRKTASRIGDSAFNAKQDVKVLERRIASLEKLSREKSMRHDVSRASYQTEGAVIISINTTRQDAMVVNGAQQKRSRAKLPPKPLKKLMEMPIDDAMLQTP